jgi:hypothetical protein
VFEGGCLCGAVRYRATGAPRYATSCHCPTCRRASGAPFVAWATFPRGEVVFERGEPAGYESSPGVERTFCRRCGTPLTYRRLDRPDEIDVTIGSLDDPDAIAPTDHTWTRHQLRWLSLRDALPFYPEARRIVSGSDPCKP